jgi:Chaperone of endosialidase
MFNIARARRLSSSLSLAAFLLLVAVAAQAQVIVPNLVYTTIKPCRIFDTRSSTGGKLMASTPQTFNIVGNTTGTYFTNQGGPSGGCAIPGFASSAPQVQAVAMNITIVAPSLAAFLNGWPTDITMPSTSLLNFPAGGIVAFANTVILGVRQDTQGGDISLVINAGSVDAFGDVVGYFSADSVTPTSGAGNVLRGAGAGNQGSSSATGSDNVGIGGSALGALTTANGNAAVGFQALEDVTTGGGNVAVGDTALKSLTTGTFNTAVGSSALYSLATGANDIAVGYLAGELLTTSESNNIDIGSPGVAGDSGAIRIGGSAQTSTYIAGISGSTSASGVAVYVNSSGQLGTATSSLRFKENVQDMGDASDGLLQLRPVTFNYKPQYDDGSHLLQYGLIAEEVAKVYPGLVEYDKDGQPLTVRYQFVNAMLLNEVQSQHKTIADQQTQITQLQSQLEDIQKTLRALAQPAAAHPAQ